MATATQVGGNEPRRGSDARGWHDKHQLNQAFKALRKFGLVAKQNFSCCRGCAGAEIATKLGERIDAGKIKPQQVKGGVFYTRQDAESRDEGRPFYLTYGPIDVAGHGDLGGTAEEVGGTVVDTLQRFGIRTEWNGNGGVSILVLPREAGVK